MRRVLLTGATGFVGKALIKPLLAAGYTVRAAIRETGQLGQAGVETVVTGDLANPVEWRQALAGCDAVVHAAAIAHIGPGAPQSLYDAVNCRAAVNLAQAAQGLVRSFVFLSSIRAQTGPSAPGVITEATPALPTDPYGVAKLAAERAIMEMDLVWTILRPVLVYGPGVKGNLARLLRLADTPIPLPLASLAGRRSMISIDNLCSAILFNLESASAARQIFIAADDTPLSLPDVVSALRSGLDRPSRLFPMPPGLLELPFTLSGRGQDWQRLNGDLVASADKLKRAGWAPCENSLAGLKRMARLHRRGQIPAPPV